MVSGDSRMMCHGARPSSALRLLRALHLPVGGKFFIRSCVWRGSIDEARPRVRPDPHQYRREEPQKYHSVKMRAGRMNSQFYRVTITQSLRDEITWTAWRAGMGNAKGERRQSRSRSANNLINQSDKPRGSCQRVHFQKFTQLAYATSPLSAQCHTNGEGMLQRGYSIFSGPWGTPHGPPPRTRAPRRGCRAINVI